MIEAWDVYDLPEDELVQWGAKVDAWVAAGGHGHNEAKLQTLQDAIAQEIEERGVTGRILASLEERAPPPLQPLPLPQLPAVAGGGAWGWASLQEPPQDPWPAEELLSRNSSGKGVKLQPLPAPPPLHPCETGAPVRDTPEPLTALRTSSGYSSRGRLTPLAGSIAVPRYSASLGPSSVHSSTPSHDVASPPGASSQPLNEFSPTAVQKHKSHQPSPTCLSNQRAANGPSPSPSPTVASPQIPTAPFPWHSHAAQPGHTGYSSGHAVQGLHPVPAPQTPPDIVYYMPLSKTKVNTNKVKKKQTKAPDGVWGGRDKPHAKPACTAPPPQRREEKKPAVPRTREPRVKEPKPATRPSSGALGNNEAPTSAPAPAPAESPVHSPPPPALADRPGDTFPVPVPVPLPVPVESTPADPTPLPAPTAVPDVHAGSTSDAAVAEDAEALDVCEAREARVPSRSPTQGLSSDDASRLGEGVASGGETPRTSPNASAEAAGPIPMEHGDGEDMSEGEGEGEGDDASAPSDSGSPQDDNPSPCRVHEVVPEDAAPPTEEGLSWPEAVQPDDPLSENVPRSATTVPFTTVNSPVPVSPPRCATSLAGLGERHRSGGSDVAPPVRRPSSAFGDDDTDSGSSADSESASGEPDAAARSMLRRLSAYDGVYDDASVEGTLRVLPSQGAAATALSRLLRPKDDNDGDGDDHCAASDAAGELPLAAAAAPPLSAPSTRPSTSATSAGSAPAASISSKPNSTAASPREMQPARRAPAVPDYSKIFPSFTSLWVPYDRTAAPVKAPVDERKVLEEAAKDTLCWAMGVLEEAQAESEDSSDCDDDETGRQAVRNRKARRRDAVTRMDWSDVYSRMTAVLSDGEAREVLEAAGAGMEYVTDKSRMEVYELITSLFERNDAWDTTCSGVLTNYVWTWRKPRPRSKFVFYGQRLNHYPGTSALTRKDALKRSLQRYRRMPGRAGEAFMIYPETYNLPNESAAFIEATGLTKDRIRLQQMASGTEGHEGSGACGVWIIKPYNLSRARGIEIITHPASIDHAEPMVVQRYIDNPFLIHGHKFDLRLYVLITSFQPLEAYVSTLGFARFASQPFTMHPSSFANRMVHLTNTSVNEEAVPPPFCTDGCSKWALQKLVDEWPKFSDLPWKTVWGRITECITKCAVAANTSIDNHACCFELLGFDVMLDDACNPWVIEVNASPSMEAATHLDERVKSSLMRNCWQVIDPPRFDRFALLDILVRRMAEAAGKRRAARTTTTTKKSELNRDIHRVFVGAAPGDLANGAAARLDADLGSFQRLAPSPMHDKICRLMRV